MDSRCFSTEMAQKFCPPLVLSQRSIFLKFCSKFYFIQRCFHPHFLWIKLSKLLWKQLHPLVSLFFCHFTKGLRWMCSSTYAWTWSHFYSVTIVDRIPIRDRLWMSWRSTTTPFLICCSSERSAWLCHEGVRTSVQQVSDRFSRCRATLVKRRIVFMRIPFLQCVS